MNIKLYDIYGEVKIKGDYESLIDCIVKNKHNMVDVDLSNADFRYMNFKGIDFSNANFHNCNFRNINITSTNFSMAIFSNADFSNANFYGSVFVNTDFSYADFLNANFKEVCLHDYTFHNIDCTGANFINTKIDVSPLYDINSKDAKLDHKLIKIYGSRDLFCYYNGRIKIGCECHTIEEWLEHGPFTMEYNLREVDEYMDYIKMVNKL